MGNSEMIAILIASLAGGLLGASATAYLAGRKLGDAMDTFRSEFRGFMAGKVDEASRNLQASFEDLNLAWFSFSSALSRLGQAAKIKK